MLVVAVVLGLLGLAAAQGSSSGGSSSSGYSSSGYYTSSYTSSYYSSGYYSSSYYYYSTTYYSGYYYSGSASAGVISGAVIGAVVFLIIILWILRVMRRRTLMAAAISTSTVRTYGAAPVSAPAISTRTGAFGKDPSGDAARLKYVVGNPVESPMGPSNVFRSGRYTGHYVEWSKEHQMTMELTFQDGRVAGNGSDPIGNFMFFGVYRDSTRRVAWVKQYIGKHCVEYRGMENGGVISGDWAMLDNPQGTFTATDRFRISLAQPFQTFAPPMAPGGAFAPPPPVYGAPPAPGGLPPYSSLPPAGVPPAPGAYGVPPPPGYVPPPSYGGLPPPPAPPAYGNFN